MQKIFLISIGAMLGANARYWLSAWVAARWGTSFPMGTFIINITGSFLLGLFITLSSQRLPLDPHWRLFFAVGFLGAYTTFSTFTVESLDLFSRGEIFAGLLNVFGSTLAGVLAAAAGALLGKAL